MTVTAYTCLRARRGQKWLIVKTYFPCWKMGNMLGSRPVVTPGPRCNFILPTPLRLTDLADI